MFDADGKLQDAKIHLETGEVRPHAYKHHFEERPKAKRDSNAPNIEPFWMRMPAATRSIGLTRRHDNSRKKLFNGVKMYLQHLRQTGADEDPLTAVPFNLVVQSELPQILDIIESVNLLGTGGSTRGLVAAELLAMLTTFDFITSEAVREFRQCSTRHSERIAACLRVIVRAFVAQEESLV